MTEKKKVYALNLFNISNKQEYLAYLKRSGKEVANRGGKVVAVGKFDESFKGDLTPRQVLILVEWESKEAFLSYRNDPELSDLHPHRENGTEDYIWQTFERLEDFRIFFADE